MDQIHSLHPNSSLDDQEKAYQHLADLSTDFVYAVNTYARIIISEVHVSDDQKIIKRASVGGEAGGDKYIVKGIVFKFAVENEKLKISRSQASKIAGHELRSLIQLINCEEPHFLFPMMALVDYRGFRLVGMTQLPIQGGQSLVHGSRDSGKHIEFHQLVAPRLQSLANKLNLEGHQVGTHLFHLPVDLEVHCPLQEDRESITSESQLYLLDFSRVFPPEAPRPGHGMDYLHKLLRPELVRQYPSQLCSDAFSGFIRPPKVRSKQHESLAKREKAINRAVSDATTYLRTNVVPVVADKLCSIPLSERADVNLINFFHSHGVNLRYMGEVRVFMSRIQKDEYWSRLILIEMVSRVIKDRIREKLQERDQLSGEGACRRKTVSILNLIFGETDESRRFWNFELFELLQAKYFTSEFTSFVSGLRSQVIEVRIDGCDGRWTLLQRVAAVMGIQFANSSWGTYHNDDTVRLFECPTPFQDTDLAEMKAKVKTLDIVALANGIVLKVKAITKANTATERKRLLMLAIDAFQSALETNSSNSIALSNLAESLSLLGQNSRAKEIHQKAILLDKEDPMSLFKYGCFKESIGDCEGAVRYYQKALDHDHRFTTCRLVLADLIAFTNSSLGNATQHYETALLHSPESIGVLHNFALHLMTKAEPDWHRAAILLEQMRIPENSREYELLVSNQAVLQSFLHPNRT